MSHLKPKSLFLTGCLILLLGTVSPVQGQIRVGITDFENRTGHIYLESWAQKIPNFLQSELSGVPEIELVERQNLKAVLDERVLSQSGLVDSASAEKLQTLSNADYLITGTINESGEWIRIDARVISTKTGRVFNEKVQCKSHKHLDEMVSLLGKNLTYQLTGRGTHQSRLKVEQVSVQPGLYATAGLSLASLLIHQQYQKKRNAYQSETDLSQINAKYESANRYYKTRGTFLILTGTSALVTFLLWTTNMSSDVIMASEPSVTPYLMADGKESWRVGLALHF